MGKEPAQLIQRKGLRGFGHSMGTAGANPQEHRPRRGYRLKGEGIPGILCRGKIEAPEGLFRLPDLPIRPGAFRAGKIEVGLLPAQPIGEGPVKKNHSIP